MKKIIIPILLVGILVIPVAARYFYNSSYVMRWEGKICPHCIVNGVNISGKKRDEAIALLKDSVKDIVNKKVIIKDGNKTYVLSYGELNPRYNIEEVVDKSLNYGSAASLPEKVRLIKNAMERRISLNFYYDKKPIKDLVDKIEKDTYKRPVNASIKLLPGCQFAVKGGEDGVKLDKERLYNDIVSSISDDTVTIETEVGVVLQTIKPEISTESLKNINARISTFSTYYGGSTAGRAANIELTVKLINGKLVMPGELFSFNATTGPRLAASGYQNAPVIIKNKLVDGVGGGVCQVSTTLYNSIIRCNIKSQRRANHTLAPAYIGPGFDATVADNIDYRFRNTLKYPILIEGLTRNGYVCFNIYSNSSLLKTKYTLINEIYEKTEPLTTYMRDITLPPGKVEKEIAPHMGYKVKVFLVGYRGDKEISKELISDDVYVKVDGVYRVRDLSGTEKVKDEL